MNLNKINKLWLILLMAPIVFMTSCGKDDDPIPVPIASFQATIDANDFFKVNFINVSQNATIYTWDFGDNVGTSDLESPSYTYTASGKYTITLTASDAAGKSAEFSQDVTIIDPDEALTLLSGSVSKTWKLLRDGAAIGIGPSYEEFSLWFYTSNDGARNCLYDDEFVFTRAGGFEYNDAGTFWGEGGIWVGDKAGLLETCFDATVANLTIDGVDKSAWLSSTTHNYVYDVAKGTITLKGLGAWMGLVKLGTSGDVATPQETVTFNAVLTSGGASGVDTLDAFWDHGNIWRARYVSYANPSDEPELPVAKLAPSFTYEKVDKVVTFTNTSKNADSYSWDFGDGIGTSTEANPVYTYADNGNYSVVLTATGNGQTGTTTVDVAIGLPFTEAAPAPAQAEADVISIYSDAYTSLAGVDTNPNWSQATIVTNELFGVDNILKLAGLDYQGIDFGGAQDLTGKTMVHVDIWSNDVITTNLSLISNGAETLSALTTEAGVWTSFDIPLSEYSSVVDITAVIQLKFDAATPVTIFVDNIYFY